ncbi:CapA family protein [Marinobacter orientalis]|uniref:CapA family protein n=1 Tax=Marinobacter orientalis TaxID=1928859 RepID=A0A7Y0RCN2_9GAMM|nr:CapA family protein [Marinobacter orientalis]NMT63799.1 CapA family protein [Marinobacter orientalis]TGX49908.1 CapA family protein [Marinobacter orientalis]
MKDEAALTIAAMGDISLGDHPVCVGHGMRKTIGLHGVKLFSDVREYWSNCDVVLGNLETVASDAGLQSEKLSSFEMRGDPAALSILKEVGFNVLNVANNHSMQHGKDAFSDTVTRLKNIGVESIGVDDKKVGKTIPFVYEKSGIRNVFLGYSIRPEEWIKDTIPYSYRRHEDALLTEVRDFRKEVNGAVVVSIHWGLEYLGYPGPEQLELGRKLVDAGADVIIGHHPHVLQPYEYYNGGLIMYSLGNFLFDLWHPETKPTVIALITISHGCIPKVEFKPVYIDSRFFPRKANPEQCEVVKRLISFDAQSIDSIFKLSPGEYRDRYKNNLAMLRPRKYRYFIKNIYRYPFSIIFQSLMRTCYRRLTGN